MVNQAPKLLITDDDIDFRDSLRAVFEPRGFLTLVAGDGEEALSILEHAPVHLLLIDMHMPRLSGLETLKQLQHRESAPPGILISGALDDSLIEEAETLAFSVLSKPIGVREITAKVREAMRTVYDWPPVA